MTIETNNIPPKMSGSMIKLLCALREAEDRHDTPTLTELSRHLGLSTGAMTQLQDSAVKNGWVTTRHSANDRRHKFLELTRGGLALVDSMRATASDGSDKSDESDASEGASAPGKEAA